VEAVEACGQEGGQVVGGAEALGAIGVEPLDVLQAEPLEGALAVADRCKAHGGAGKDPVDRDVAILHRAAARRVVAHPHGQALAGRVLDGVEVAVLHGRERRRLHGGGVELVGGARAAHDLVEHPVALRASRQAEQQADQPGDGLAGDEHSSREPLRRDAPVDVRVVLVVVEWHPGFAELEQTAAQRRHADADPAREVRLRPAPPRQEGLVDPGEGRARAPLPHPPS
jgi:hypothetical protein